MRHLGWALWLLTAAAATAAQEMTVAVDATQVTRQQLHARLTIPVTPGPVRLLYPQWIPGEHGPTGPVTDVTGLTIRGAGEVLPWTRDPYDLFAVEVEVPSGVETLDVQLDLFTPPPGAGGFTGTSSSSQLAVLSWNQVLLYPEGTAAADLQVAASVRWPAGWEAGTALTERAREAGWIRYAAADLETLVDSPVLAGAHVQRVAIGPDTAPPHEVILAADSEAALEIPDDWKAACDRLVAEAGALFGSWPMRRYRFLLALSDEIAAFGLEHHESSDNRVAERTLVDETLRASWMGATLLPHEYVHVWNGKFRRPAAMLRDTYNEPKDTGLLWVYEGLTSYLEWVLATRSGFRTPAAALEALAMIADGQRQRRGRQWRPLEDTAVAAHLLFAARGDGRSWRRGVDFYNEGMLIWLEVDTILRERTEGRASLDDVCRLFFARGPETPRVSGYELDDLVATLSMVAPHDWEGLLRARVRETTAAPPLEGLRRGGWRLVYEEEPTQLWEVAEAADEATYLGPSIGMSVGGDGGLFGLTHDGAAARAGIAAGATLLAVNGRQWNAQRLKEAIRRAADGAPLELLVQRGDRYTTHRVDAEAGLRYPRLQRGDGPDRLTAILAPRAE